MLPESLKWSLWRLTDDIRDVELRLSVVVALQMLEAAATLGERTRALGHLESLLIGLGAEVEEGLVQELEAFKETALQSLYFAHPSAVVDTGAVIGSGGKIWHFTHLMKGSVLGKDCNLGQNVLVASGVRLGDRVKVQNNVSLYTGLTCGDDVFIGPSAVFTNVINPRSAVNRKSEYLPTHIGEGASIGANATIICGHRIGRYAFIGAGAVVTKEVPDFALVKGTPAVLSGWMSKAGHKLTQISETEFSCPQSGERYEFVDGRMREV